MPETPLEGSEQEKNARQTLKVILNLQKKEEQRLLENGSKEELEYYLAVSHRDYEDLIRRKAEENSLIWELYKEYKKENPDHLEMNKYRAGKKYDDYGKMKLDIKAYQRRFKMRFLSSISSANDDIY